jgi:proteic killer suppression protein
VAVIVSFADSATEALFHGAADRRARRIPREVTSVAVRKLDMLNAAVHLTDLRVPPGNRLEALRGDLAGRHSIRVNDQWRLVFRWTESGPAEVRLTDYH